MKKFLFIISILISQSYAADTTAFYKWWETTTYTKSHNVVPKGIIHKTIPLVNLKPAQYLENILPLEYSRNLYRIFIIHKDSSYEINIMIPTDSGQTTSLLGVYPYNKWIPIELYPFTSDYYGADEVEFTLYWLPEDKIPLIEVVSNGPACVPVDLFRFNTKEKIYKNVRHLCGG